jgi:hypothetical protein
MDQQTLYLTAAYKRRIDEVAHRNPADVTLIARNTSGKTYTLFVNVPMPAPYLPMQRAVVRMHRSAHKAFWGLVKQAEAWLAGWKLLYAPQQPPVVTERPEQQKLIAAAAKIPVKAEIPMVAAAKRDTLHGYEGKAQARTTTANKFYRGTDIYTRSLHDLMAELKAEGGLA